MTDVYWAPTEAQFQAHIIGICKALRLDWYHTHDSRRSVPGFPDLVIAGPGGILFAELKTLTGRVTKAQQHWLDILKGAGLEVHLWRPTDADTIRDRLMTLARPADRTAR